MGPIGEVEHRPVCGNLLLDIGPVEVEPLAGRLERSHLLLGPRLGSDTQLFRELRALSP